ncbi:MAG: HD domain-containing protein [Treponema sp.]|nr:HD domain-containing protein [Treponema sp.]
MTLYQILLGIQYASIVLMLLMCAYITRQWKKPLHGWLFFYSMVMLMNNAGYLGLMMARTEETVVLLWQVCYLARVWIPYALLQFVMILCGKKRRMWVSNTLALFHIATNLIILSMRHNRLYYTSFGFTREGIFPHFTHTDGIWFYIYNALIALYFLYELLALFITLRKQENSRKRHQIEMIILAIATDCVFFALDALNLTPGYDVTVLGYTVASLFLFYAIFRYEMLGTKVLAWDFVIDRISEGVIVTDEDDNVVEFNKKAQSILPALTTNPSDALAQIHVLIDKKKSLNVGGRKYTPKENLLTDDRHAAGKIYMLTDDTVHYQHTEQLTQEMMFALSKAVDAKDHYTNGHSLRVAMYAKEIAHRLGMSVDDQEQIFEMGLLHDIGKIGVSEEIINKKGRLTDDEFAKIKEHTVIGSNILREVSDMPELADGARNHHERYDGSGYPDGLSGEAIPLAARIICVADCYDAMTSTRTYSSPMAQEKVRAEFERCKGSQFDPRIADVMISMIDDDKKFTMHE